MRSASHVTGAAYKDKQTGQTAQADQDVAAPAARRVV